MSQSFPAWRLKNGIKNATDEELDHAAESCEWWSWGFAAILIVGLIGEGGRARLEARRSDELMRRTRGRLVEAMDRAEWDGTLLGTWGAIPQASLWSSGRSRRRTSRTRPGRSSGRSRPGCPATTT